MNETTLRLGIAKLYEYELDVLDPDDCRTFEILKDSEMFIEYTSTFTRIQWNTYIAVLHIKTEIENFHMLELNKNKIISYANKMIASNEDYIVTDLDLIPRISQNEEIKFNELDKNETLNKTIKDAEDFIKAGNYLSAIDRIHTTLHGYLRWRLDEENIEYNESDTIMQLYSKFHKNLEDAFNNNEINKLTLTAIRSASGVIDSLNTARNRFSLAHPNDETIDNNEAKLLIGLSKYIFEYIENTRVKSPYF